MTHTQAIERLIRQWFRGPRPLDAGALRFAESSLGVEGDTALADILGQDSDEAQCLRELAFFPDQKLREDIEQVVDPEADRLDSDSLAAGLCSTPLLASLILPAGTLVTLPLDAAQVTPTVRQLRIDGGAGADLCAALAQYMSPPSALRAKVMLRVEGVEPLTGGQDFLLAVVRGHDHRDSMEEPRALELLRYAARLVRSAGPSATLQGMQDLLRSRHAQAVAGLERAKRMGRMMATQPLEVLAAHGLREPHLDVEDFHREMRMTRELAWSVYGCVLPDGMVVSQDMGVVDEVAELARKIDLLG